MGDNIDKYGHCVSCHKNLVVERAIDGKVMKVFLPDKDETEFLLDDGSKMRVCICKLCKRDMDFNDPKVNKQIMEAVINGWQLEVDSLVQDEKRPEWDVERGKNHMRVYSNKKILFNSEFTENHIVEGNKSEILKEKEEAMSGKREK